MKCGMKARRPPTLDGPFDHMVHTDIEVADAIDDSSRSTTGSIRSRRSRGTTSSRLSQAAELWLDVADIEQSII